MNIKVVKIIDEDSLVINIGLREAVKFNDKFAVFIPGDEVIDPDTNESLGTLDTIKCYLKPKDILEKMTVCVNAETALTSFGAAMTGGTPQINLLGGLTNPKRLPVDFEEISGGLQPRTKVKIGDFVRKINDD